MDMKKDLLLRSAARLYSLGSKWKAPASISGIWWIRALLMHPPK